MDVPPTISSFRPSPEPARNTPVHSASTTLRPFGPPFAGILAVSRRARAGGNREPPGTATRLASPSKGGNTGGPGAETIDPQKGPAAGDRRGDGHARDEARDEARDDARDCDVVEPATRHAAFLALPATTAACSASDDARRDGPARARSLEELLPALVRRIAWAGDKHKGTVRMELGAGAYAGTIVVVHADGARVRVELCGSEGPELDRLRARLDGRLRAHGLDVESVF